MMGKKDGQVQYHPDNSGGDSTEWRSEFQIAMGGFDEWPAQQDKNKAWEEGKERHY